MENSKKGRIVTGMRPTGKLHLGHYLGVLKNMVKLQNEYECFFFVADWHALTTKFDCTQDLIQNTKDVVLDWLAAGIDPEKAHIYIQSHLPQTAELHIYLSMITPQNWVERDPTLKDLVKSDDVDVVYCVPAIDIVPVVEAVKGTNVEVGAENMYFEEKGAYTGEISADMLLDAGVKYVIIGHSERRDYFKECDCLLNKKVKKALEKGLIPILCCGETLEQREMGVTMDWIRLQIKSDLADVTADQVKGMVIAYEPIWAIGTGKTATTEQAEEVCKCIRECIAEMYDTDTAEAVRIQYGGSVNAGNAAELFAQPDIDGGLVGGASLKADFGKIVNYK